MATIRVPNRLKKISTTTVVVDLKPTEKLFQAASRNISNVFLSAQFSLPPCYIPQYAPPPVLRNARLLTYREDARQFCFEETQTVHNYWNDWYFGWGWVLWFGFIFLMFSSIGNWGYTYRAHQKYEGSPRKEAFDILNERYARGEITREQHVQMRADISRI